MPSDSQLEIRSILQAMEISKRVLVSYVDCELVKPPDYFHFMLVVYFHTQIVCY